MSKQYHAIRCPFGFSDRLKAAGWRDVGILDYKNPLICTIVANDQCLPIPGNHLRSGGGNPWCRLIAPNLQALTDPDHYLGEWEASHNIEFC